MNPGVYRINGEFTPNGFVELEGHHRNVLQAAIQYQTDPAIEGTPIIINRPPVQGTLTVLVGTRADLSGWLELDTPPARTECDSGHLSVPFSVKWEE